MQNRKLHAVVGKRVWQLFIPCNILAYPYKGTSELQPQLIIPWIHAVVLSRSVTIPPSVLK